MKIVTWSVILALLAHLAIPPLLQAQEISEQEKKVIAIVDFQNTKGDPEMEYLVKGIPESIITYLGRSGKLQIVERDRLQEALKEMKLGMSGIVDSQTAVEVGRAVGANAIMLGSFLQIGEKIRINTRLIDVKTSQVITTSQVDGRPGEEIFDLMDRTAESMQNKLLVSERQVEEPVEEIKIAEQVEEPQQPIIPPVEIPEKKGGSKTLLWVGLGALAAGGVAAAVLLSGGDEDKGDTGTISIRVRIR